MKSFYFGCNFIMSRLVDVIFKLYKKCQIWQTTPTKVKKEKEKNENHLNKKSYHISSFVLRSNWGSKNTRFDNLEKEINKFPLQLRMTWFSSGLSLCLLCFACIYLQSFIPRLWDVKSELSRNLRTHVIFKDYK